MGYFFLLEISPRMESDIYYICIEKKIPAKNMLFQRFNTAVIPCSFSNTLKFHIKNVSIGTR